MSPQTAEATVRLTTWLRHGDVSSEELGELTCDEVLARLAAIDWAAELALEERLGAEDRACCSPSLGMAWPDGHQLHLSPGRTDTLLWHVHFPRGLWQRLFHEAVEVVPAVGEREEAPELVRLFFACEYDRLRDRSRRRPVFSTRADQAHR